MSPSDAPDEAVNARPLNRDGQQALPVQSGEDTDRTWGEQPEPDEDDRFYRDRPPHWDSE